MFINEENFKKDVLSKIPPRNEPPLPEDWLYIEQTILAKSLIKSCSLFIVAPNSLHLLKIRLKHWGLKQEIKSS